jgi:DegV family protein with EDD domain
MGKIAFITDSTAYLPEELVQEYNITVLPQILIWGEENLRDGVDITPNEFYQRLANSDTIPTTAQVSVASMKEAFEKRLQEGYEDVVGIFISSKLSGTLQSAYQARDLLDKETAARIHIIDSFSTAMGLGFQVLAGARAAAEGKSLTGCMEAIDRARQNHGVYFVVETLEFLHRGGRIGGAQRLLGTMLNLKPVLAIENGRVEPIEKIRTKKKALARISEIVREKTAGKTNVRLATLHANAEDEAQALLSQLEAEIHPVESLVASVSPVVGTHAGPGVVGIVYVHD